MNKIVWTDEYSVGVASLDEQHKKIIELIKEKGPLTGAEIQNTLNEDPFLLNFLHRMLCPI